jgi:hypothetical protein
VRLAGNGQKLQENAGMSTVLTRLGGAAVLVLLCMAPLGAQPPLPPPNPVLQIAAPNVTCVEAGAALSEASGWRVQVHVPSSGAAAVHAGRLAERHSFDWRGVTLANALRQLCARYGLLSFSRGGAGFLLSPTDPDTAKVALAEPPVVKAEAGVRVMLDAVSVFEVKEWPSGNEARPRAKPGREVWVVLSLDPGTLPFERLAGFYNTSAQDDQGHHLAALQPGTPHPRMASTAGAAFSDRALVVLRLDEPHPQARRLNWIESELYTYEPTETVRGTVSLPAPPDRSVQLGGLVVSEVRRVESAPGVHEVHYRLTGDVVRQELMRLTLEGITASGRRVPSTGAGGSGRREGAGFVWQYRARFQGLHEPVERVTFSFSPPPRKKKLLTLRLTQLELPQAVPSIPGGPFAFEHPTAIPENPEPAHPAFQDPAGGTIASRVLIGNDRSAAGSLAIGLSTRGAGTWAAARWRTVAVDSRGEAILPAVAPGRYRVLRAFRAARPTPVPAMGDWVGPEVEVDVAAGRVARLPDLRLAARNADLARRPAARREAAAPGAPTVRVEPTFWSSGTTQLVREGGLAQGASQSPTALSLKLSVIPGKLAAEQLAGVSNVSARDDRGNLALSPGTQREYTPLVPELGRDHAARVTVAGVDRGSQRLAWAEGDLMGYALPVRRLLEVDLRQANGPPGKARLGAVTVEEVRVQESSGGNGEPSGHEVQLLLSAPKDGKRPAADLLKLEPKLYGEGAMRLSFRQAADTQDAGDRFVSRVRLFCPNLGPPTRLELIQEINVGQPVVRLAGFRVENIALPAVAPGPFTVRRARPPRLDPNETGGVLVERHSPPDPHPFYRSGGGTLVVQLEKPRPALVGSSLLLGLARQDGSPRAVAAGGGFRWIDLVLDREGRVTLTDVAPGRYRVRTRFPGEPMAPLQRAGVDDAAEVVVGPGKTVTLPPLRRGPSR